MQKCGFYIEGLGAERVLDKLAHNGVKVLAAQKPQKNRIVVWVDGKDGKKVFAILQTSCYNIKKVRPRGFLRVAKLCKRAAGLLLGAVLFLAGVLFFQSRVLEIRVEGSGAYYGEEVKAILRENGTKFFSPSPRDTAKLAACVMALPRVSFCSFSHEGGILTVDVEVNDEQAVLENEPLRAPETGVVERLTVIRGTPLAAVGDVVKKGDIVVSNEIVSETGTRGVVVIAEVVVAYTVSATYPLAEEEALRQAYLDYGELENIRTMPTEGGTLVEGTARSGAALNLQ